MKRMIIAIALLAAFLGSGCGIDTPNMPDGQGSMVIVVMDTSGFFPGSSLGEPFYMDSTEVSIQSRTHIYASAGKTNETGVAHFEHLPTGNYTLFARREVSVGPNRMVFTGFGDVKVRGAGEFIDTILVSAKSVSNLVINEIHFTGSCAATYYFYDQYVELYNASEDTLYLDNIILTRQRQASHPEMESLDYVTAIHAFQLKGSGRQWPLGPKSFAVIAADAVNHKQWCPNAADLSRADYETFNALGNDYDVLDVPNFESIFPTKATDYLINLNHNAIVIAASHEYTFDEDEYLRVPIASIIDGVEYSVNPGVNKHLTIRVDAGFAGNGIARYSGWSTERREPGLDTNNSTFDFVSIFPPTPGYQAGRPRWMPWR